MIRSVIAIIGMLLVVGGCGMFHFAAGCIAGGIFMIFIAAEMQVDDGAG